MVPAHFRNMRPGMADLAAPICGMGVANHPERP